MSCSEFLSFPGRNTLKFRCQLCIFLCLLGHHGLPQRPKDRLGLATKNAQRNGTKTKHLVNEKNSWEKICVVFFPDFCVNVICFQLYNYSVFRTTLFFSFHIISLYSTGLQGDVRDRIYTFPPVQEVCTVYAQVFAYMFTYS